MRRAGSALAVLAVAAGLAAVVALGRGRGAAPALVLATTTSVEDSGLLDVLIPAFAARTGLRLKPVAVGSGEAIAMARRGAADVLIAHAPEDEQRLVADGVALDRRTFMANRFVVLGPPEDPAGVRDAPSAREAFRRLRAGGHRFVSRGDRSGTHRRELALWGGPPPDGRAYIVAGAGMGATLLLADQKDAYTLADDATFLAFRGRMRLVPLCERGEELVNRYSVLRVRAGREGSATLADWVAGDEARELIRAFGRERFGRPLFSVDQMGAPPPVEIEEPGP